MQKKNVVYMKKIEYKFTMHRRLLDDYKLGIYDRVEAIIEGAFANGYNACLDDVRSYLPKDIIIGERPRDKLR